MDRRTYESPMDWEYEKKGPVDPTSPFTHAAMNNQHSVLSSPSRAFSSQPNPFAPKQMRPLPPSSADFAPKVPSRTTGSPFRNPAFTTPRKPFDELVLSEASGPDDSPALTETSDFPGDTPEAERTEDTSMGGTFGPSKVDKTLRYGKAGFLSKKHSSGRGEIRGHRDYSVADVVRKRKRHNHDRDVSSGVLQLAQEWEGSEADSDASFAVPSRGRRRPKSKQPGQKGVVSSLFHMLDEHPNAPDNLYRWIQLLVNFFLVTVFVYIGWAIVDTVRSDIRNANEAARLELMSRMTECQNQYTMNECARKDRPALKAMCDEWYDCMIQNPESIMRVKVTAKQIAEIINEFSDAMNLKAWGFFFAILIVCAFANNVTLGRNGAGKAHPAAPAQPSSAVHDSAMPPDSTPGFMWVPVQTPTAQRYGMLDEGTDMDSPPPRMKAISSPYKHSARRSPSKTERSLSPVKYGWSPSKGY